MQCYLENAYNMIFSLSHSNIRMSEGTFCRIEVYIILIQVKILTENYDQILHKSTLTKTMIISYIKVVYLHQSI